MSVTLRDETPEFIGFRHLQELTKTRKTSHFDVMDSSSVSCLSFADSAG